MLIGLLIGLWILPGPQTGTGTQPHLAVFRREDLPYGGLSRCRVFAQRPADGSEGANLPPRRLVLRLR
jgi:hypothetical protein